MKLPLPIPARTLPDRGRRRLLGGATAALACAPLAGVAQIPAGLARPDATLGIALLIRHAATEPGVGDPPGWRLGDCASQRQLSAAGREQARRLGQALAERGLVPEVVRSSRWCRCLDTASLAFGRVQPWAALDSFFEDRGREPAQTAELRQALIALPAGSVQAWVTHQVNISAFSGEWAAMGEVLVVQARRDAAGVGTGGWRVHNLGRLALP
ncbi:MAG: histidine phosphatase family protein [Burkholderiaceae bacterium]|nr:histidine phosphatase family protein [Burkholderiaceae bacterium]